VESNKIKSGWKKRTGSPEFYWKDYNTATRIT